MTSRRQYLHAAQRCVDEIKTIDERLTSLPRWRWLLRLRLRRRVTALLLAGAEALAASDQA